MDSILNVYITGIKTVPPSITDWIGGVGALLAIVAAIWSFVRLFMKDKEKEIQLQSLSELAQNQGGINSTMSLQLKEQQKQTGLLEQYLALMMKSEMSKVKSIELQAELAELERKRRKADILPIFSLDHGVRSGQGIAVRLRNIGKTAILKSLKAIDAGDTTLKDQDIERRLVEGGTFDFSVGLLDRTKKTWNPNFKVEIHFDDVDGNRYKQVFENTSSAFPISNPVEIEP